MEEELENFLDQIKNTNGDEQIKLFINYCIRLIELKEKGVLSEEEAAYKMVGAMQFENLANSPECDAIFDIAGTTEISRATSYAQPMGQWDEKTANKVKQEEWKELVAAVENAKKSLKIN